MFKLALKVPWTNKNKNFSSLPSPALRQYQASILNYPTYTWQMTLQTIHVCLCQISQVFSSPLFLKQLCTRLKKTRLLIAKRWSLTKFTNDSVVLLIVWSLFIVQKWLLACDQNLPQWNSFLSTTKSNSPAQHENIAFLKNLNHAISQYHTYHFPC